MKSLRLQGVAATVLFTLWELTFAEEILQAIEGSVGGGNFTYYKLARHGHMRIELKSLSGDADLYVSDEITSPNCVNYKQESVSCGLDVVEIPASYKRPIGIGIYGHFLHDVSRYRITIIHVATHDEENYDKLIKKFNNYKEVANLDNYKHHQYQASQRQQQARTVGSGGSSDDDEDEGSTLWQIIVTVLKLFFEIIL